MAIITTALMALLETIEPGGLLVLGVVALWLHLDDCISDVRDARQPAASTTTPNITEE